LSLLLEGGEKPPDPDAIPQPEPRGCRPLLTLAEITPGRYVDTVARVSSLSAVERCDRLGVKIVYCGQLEDRTFRVPFICHNTTHPLERNCVYKIVSAYVHEFRDRRLILILTEYSRICPKQVDGVMEYVWMPRIGSIPRPVSDVTLEGIISKIYSASGLVKRCNLCKMVIRDICPKGCGSGWSWDFRISSNLYDGSGAIRTVFSRQIAAALVGRSLTEILFLANTAPHKPPAAGSELITYSLKLPREFDVVECVAGDVSTIRSRELPLVTEGLTVAYLPCGSEVPKGLLEACPKKIDPREPNGVKIVRRLIEKTLEYKIKGVTGKPLTQGIYLLDDPIPLYGCEQAKLYVGFSARVILHEGEARVEAQPKVVIRESVWDYVKWRRSRGASAEAVEKTLKHYRSIITLSPYGQLGHIETLLFKKAGEQATSDRDPRSLVEFWRSVYGVYVEPNETPLLKVRLMGCEALFTYPPSTAYFDESVIYVNSAAKRLAEAKSRSLSSRVKAVLNKALHSFAVGSCALHPTSLEQVGLDAQTLLLSDINHRLLGRFIRARGRIVQLRDQLCFFPQRVMEVK